MEDGVLFAFFLTLFAGLSTGIGSLIAFFAHRTNTRFLSFSLGLSAGVMIYVSMVEIFAKAQDELVSVWGELAGNWITVLSFFGGILFIGLIDRVIPSFENPHELRKIEDLSDPSSAQDFARLKRTGLVMAMAIGIHNFPEGFATFFSALSDPNLGIAIAFAIAIHNIPEGISVSVPIYYATGSRKKALLYSVLSGVSEPLGAVLGYVLLREFFSPSLMGFLFAFVAGIMVFISLDELLPAAKEYGEHHLATYGLVVGMAIMAVSLLLFMS